MAIKWGSTWVTVVKWGNTTCTQVKWGSTVVFPTGGYSSNIFSPPFANGFYVIEYGNKTAGPLNFTYSGRYDSKGTRSRAFYMVSNDAVDWQKYSGGKISVTFTLTTGQNATDLRLNIDRTNGTTFTRVHFITTNMTSGTEYTINTYTSYYDSTPYMAIYVTNVDANIGDYNFGVNITNISMSY